MQKQHNGRPCWASRAVSARYVFHTGKSRWCVGKQLDDGAKCWAYLADPTQDTRSPTACQEGVWVCCDVDGQWKADTKVHCKELPPTDGRFEKIREDLEGEMKQYIDIFDHHAIRTLWKRLDYNGNGIVSLAEVDKMVVELCSGGQWPAYLNSKPALMRAFKKATLKDGNGDDWVQRGEFRVLLLNIFWFAKLFQIFKEVDTGSDRRVDFNEFKAGLSKLGMGFMSAEDEKAEFDKIDRNGGGQVLFVEFCAWVRDKLDPDSNNETDEDLVSGEHAGRNIRAKFGDKATAELVVSKKTFKSFDDVEAKIKAIMKDHKGLTRLWHCVDYNGNNIVSLAEIDKMVVENYPSLNHKPALMRAYKKTIKEGNGDDWVQKREFKTLMGCIFYFNKCYWLFDEINGDDRRINLKEFSLGISLLGVQGVDVKAEFSKIDKNGGGQILFEEFCHWFTMKSCPEAFQGYVQ